MEVKLPIGIVILVDNKCFKIAPAVSDSSCKGCAFACRSCDLLCGYQDIIFIETDEPFKEEV